MLKAVDESLSAISLELSAPKVDQTGFGSVSLAINSVENTLRFFLYATGMGNCRLR